MLILTDIQDGRISAMSVTIDWQSIFQVWYTGKPVTNFRTKLYFSMSNGLLAVTIKTNINTYEHT